MPGDAGALRAARFALHGGQILGIAGMSGNGQAALMRVLSGETLSPAQAVQLDGQAAGQWGPARRRAAGLGFVPEERLGRGAVPALDLRGNVLLTGLHARLGQAMHRGGFLREGAAAGLAREIITRFAVKAAGPMALAGGLSGGNLQKFIVGRETLLAPRVLLVAQPTWGVDVGAAALIHQALFALREQGVAVLVVSDDLDELMTICDDIAVMAEGRLSPVVSVRETTVETLGRWMGGAFATRPENAVPA